MNSTLKFLPALLAAPLLLALEPRGDGLVFHPAKDSSLAKTSEMNMSFELGEMTMIVDGNDMSGQIPTEAGGTMDMTMTWTDKYVDIQKDGKPLDLVRSYDEMKASMEMSGGGESNNVDIPDFEALAGKSIRFLWNAEKKDYDVSYHECEGDEKLLKTQDVDMDYRAMLPQKEVSVGDSWDVSTEFMRQILDRIKNSDMGDDEAGIQAILQDELFPQLEKLLEKFKTTCTYKERRSENGVDAAVIAITMEGKGEIDLKSMIESLIEEQIKKVGQEIEFEITKAMLSLSLNGKGEILWDIGAGHLLSSEQNADFNLMIGFDASFDGGGESHSVEAEIELPGKYAQTMALKK